MLNEVTRDMTNVIVVPFDGLLVEFAKKMDACMIVRGLRAITDFEYELQMAQTNHKLEPSVETVFLTTSLEYSYLSSTIVKEMAKYKADLNRFVPRELIDDVIKKTEENIRNDLQIQLATLKDIVHEYRMHEKNKEDIEQAVLKLQNAEYSYRRFKMEQMLLENTEKDENKGDE